jgi:hypothetical protein
MKVLHKILLCLGLVAVFSTPVFAATDSPMTPAQSKEWLKTALTYGFNLNTTDYTKYISTDYVEQIDGETFNFQQWLHHMNGIRGMMKSYQLSFNEIVAEGDQIAASYDVHAVKKDGTTLDIRIIAIFTVKNGKMVACDELTHMMSGPQTDQNLSDKR